MPKKQFIDKKNSVKFHLVHRSQKDPLAADENAPQRVLQPVNDNQAVKSKKDSKEEQRKFGIFFDDDYDYLQHLQDVNVLNTEWERVKVINKDEKNTSSDEKLAINLPSSVFESNVEENVGLLNKAAPISGPVLDLDPDLVAALDDDFDFSDPDNQLEDDFVALASGNDFEGKIEGDDACFYEECGLSEEEEDDDVSFNFPQYTFKDEETKSRFTEYSISSSVVKRNKQLVLLDDKFEKMYADYDEHEIGSLDCENIEGYLLPDTNLLLHECAEQYEKEQKDDIPQSIRDRVKDADSEISSTSENKIDNNLQKVIIELKGKKNWDCESVLSNYSKAYNHPKLISDSAVSRRLTVDAKTGIPKDILKQKNQNKLTAENLAQHESEIIETKMAAVNLNTTKSSINVMCLRPKNESPQLKKERKQALKMYRKERRKERNTNIEAFKEEKKRQEKILLNKQKNIQGNHIW